MVQKEVSLEEVRQKLARLEDNILFSLIGRSEFKTNKIMYVPEGVEVPEFEGSFFDYLLLGTERLHATAGRYLDKTEHPFSENLPTSLANRKIDECPLPEGLSVNRNREIKTIYLSQIPSFCEEGDDNQYGAAALWDIRCLQDLSRRIHFGMFVAESKYQQDSEGYTELVKDKNIRGIVDKLRNIQVEEQVLNRLREKGKRYGFNPELVHNFYKTQVIPMTIDVEVEYLFKRAKS
jgi:chorismate mutase